MNKVGLNDESIAHKDDNGRLHSLNDHLYGTAKMAAGMAREFGCDEWGRLAGLWHDLGKFSEDFQEMIHSSAGPGSAAVIKHVRVDHSTAGGIYAVEKIGMIGRVLAYVIAGHHAGLPDWPGDVSGMKALSQRIRKTELLDAAIAANPPVQILEQNLPTVARRGFDPALWIRMLFSCVVDADFLDTEGFFDSQKAVKRAGYQDLTVLLSLFSAYMEEKRKGAVDIPVNRFRAEILQQCTSMAQHEQGIFTLTVPTGGGKTLSSMAFALHHAIKHKKRRIIYVIPYTSIIEQTAEQFRKIFGDAVVEHHSNFDTSDFDTNTEEPETKRNILACENWDAPVIVTTSVQFFESLFASRTSRCRKLHNIVNSVVVLDETQLLPPEFLNPILSAIKELRKNYGVTFVLSTATQPAFSPHKGFDFNFDGLPDTVEIIKDPQSLHRSFERVEVSVPANLQARTSWEELTSGLMKHPTVLCIVNRRDDCRKLFELMPAGTIHLSALMCGAHRSAVIGLIKERLKNNIPTRVISTQLVEAGVDLDFPVVYRALAGLDSIAQAAGRCNREGRLEKGSVVVFVPESELPTGHLRQAGELGRRLLADRTCDPLSPDRFTLFFKELYWLKGEGLDKYGILKDLEADREFRFSFRTAAGKFHLIDETKQASVIVCYGEGEKFIKLLKTKGPERWLLRKLQRYIVNLPVYLHKKLVTEGAIIEASPGIYAQGHGALYRDDLGFCPDKSVIYEPDELIT